MGFATTYLSFASVLPFATCRTRSGTAFGNVWKRDSVVAASGDNAGMLLLLQIVDNWMRIRIGHLPSLSRRVLGGRARGCHRGSGVSVWKGWVCCAAAGAVQHRGRHLALWSCSVDASAAPAAATPVFAVTRRTLPRAPMLRMGHLSRVHTLRYIHLLIFSSHTLLAPASVQLCHSVPPSTHKLCNFARYNRVTRTQSPVHHPILSIHVA